MQSWRQGPDDGSEGGAPDGPARVAATTDTTAVLRAALTVLEEGASDPTAVEATAQRPALDTMLDSIGAFGATFEMPPVQHVAGQMRVLLRCVRERTLPWTEDMRTAMYECLTSVLAQLGSDAPISDQLPELRQWNSDFQRIMAEVAPSAPPEDTEAPGYAGRMESPPDRGTPTGPPEANTPLPSAEPVLPAESGAPDVPGPEASVAVPAIPRPSTAPPVGPSPIHETTAHVVDNIEITPPPAIPSSSSRGGREGAPLPPLGSLPRTGADLPPVRAIPPPLGTEELDVEELERIVAAGCRHRPGS